MKVPGFRDVRLPTGAVPSNWPLLLGAGLSGILLVMLLLTSEEPLVDDTDPLDVPAPELGEITAPDPRTLAGGADDVRRAAELERARQEEAERRRQTELERVRREAQEDARRRAAELARAEERLNQLRARRSQPALQQEQVDPMELLARTSGEADLLETLRLEELARRVEALRAPVVVSSARGIGERTHQLRTVPPPVPRAVPPSASAPPPLPALAAAPPPAPAGSLYDDPGAPVRDLVRPSSAGVVQPGPGVSSGAAPGRAQRPGSFDLGPPADGGLGTEPTGVVVTPNDGRDYRLYEGTMVPAVLQTQLDGTFSGPLSAQVTRHVYSADRQRVLIPRGTIALGTSQGVEDLWQGRLAIGFHRLIFPDGRWVRLEFAGLNGLGETSLADQVNRHYMSMLGAAGAVGLLAGFAQSGGQGQFRSAVSEQMAASSLQILVRFLNRLPEITIRAGHRVNIRMMSDLVIPAEAAWEVE